MTTRRNTLCFMAVSLLAARQSFSAEPPNKIWRIGFLAPRHVVHDETDSYYGGFRQGMKALGYIEGKDFIIEWRSSEGRNDRLNALATELVNLKVDLILTSGHSGAKAALNATTSIPIVVGAMGDPVSSGLVKSMAKPGGNLTGINILAGTLVIKKLDVLMKLVPGLNRVGILVDPNSPATKPTLQKFLPEAHELGVTVVVGYATTPEEITRAFELAVQQNVQGMIVTVTPVLQQNRQHILRLLSTHRMPSAGGYAEFVDAGGLSSYGSNLLDPFRRSAVYVDKIFKGAHPGDLPIEQPNTYEIVVNAGTAKALGLTIPRSLLASATRIISPP